MNEIEHYLLVSEAFQVYALCSIDGEIRYVGKTKRSLLERLGAHLEEACIQTRKGKILMPVLRWIFESGTDIQALSLGHYSSEKEAYENERLWIARFGFPSNTRLFNVDEGGRGWSKEKAREMGKKSWKKRHQGLTQDELSKVAGKNFWGDMTAEERSNEMKRRRATHKRDAIKSSAAASKGWETRRKKASQ